MNKELDALMDIWDTTQTDWNEEPYEYDLFDEEDERFALIAKALKRNEPMKPIYGDDGVYKWCGTCKEVIDAHFKSFCQNCGQRIDWGVDE